MRMHTTYFSEETWQPCTKRERDLANLRVAATEFYGLVHYHMLTIKSEDLRTIRATAAKFRRQVAKLQKRLQGADVKVEA